MSYDYLDKENVLMPDSFSYRRAHYDYEIIKSYASKIKEKAVLHLGCNLGVNSILLAEQGARVFAVDVQPKAIERANEIFQNYLNEHNNFRGAVQFLNQDFRTLKIPYLKTEEKASFVFSVDTMEHIREEDLPIIQDNIIQHCDADSEIFIHVPHERSFFDPAHVCLYSEARFRDLWSDRFEIVKLWTTDDGTRNNQGKITKVTGQRVNAVMRPLIQP